MHFDPPLKSATLINRYKRFLADITLPDGEERTIHCANTGAMTGCAMQGDTVWFSTSSNQKRKYPNSWELTQTQDGHFICINTQQANRLAIEAIENGTITELSEYDELQSEVKYGSENSRIDVLLLSENKPKCYVEVKSVTLLDDTVASTSSSPKISIQSGSGQGFFPDAKTVRGQKHLRELTEMVQNGHRAVLLFTVLHSGIEKVSPALHIDAKYSQLLKSAIAAGVEVFCYKAKLDQQGIMLEKSIPLVID